jgi:TrmH family RNA methyltransferase
MLSSQRAVMKSYNIRIILVQTSHPGNIGAVARAMKTMGLSQLTLVKPRFFPHPDATAMASRAEDILEQAQVVDSLAEAISDSQFVVGASVRPRSLEIATRTPYEMAPIVLDAASNATVSIVFGRESTGLTNDELDLCHQLITIPSDENYGSLNLSQAVQVICYELRMNWLTQKAEKKEIDLENLATAQETAGFFDHLEKTLWEIEFIRPHNPKEVMRKLRRLFGRTNLKKEEINILRGILTAINIASKKKNLSC